MVLQSSKGIPKIYIIKGNQCLKIKNGQKYLSPKIHIELVYFEKL